MGVLSKVSHSLPPSLPSHNHLNKPLQEDTDDVVPSTTPHNPP